MSNYKLNHSRYIDNGARDIGQYAYEDSRNAPTQKQKKFFNVLQELCRVNNVDSGITWYIKTRPEYADAIDRMIKALQAAGVEVHGNDKEATYVASVYEDYRGRLTVQEDIVINDGTPKRKAPKIENIFIK